VRRPGYVTETRMVTLRRGERRALFLRLERD
jgi:hypothetical protein